MSRTAPASRPLRRRDPVRGGRVRLYSWGAGLDGIDLVVEPGRTVALVGATGGGKSTLVDLVPRLYDPAAGVVWIDGIDVRELTLKSLRDQISIVPQDGMLFAGTFYENIAYGRAGCTKEEVEQAARAALIHDVIVAQEHGTRASSGSAASRFPAGSASAGDRAGVTEGRADRPVGRADDRPRRGVGAPGAGGARAAAEVADGDDHRSTVFHHPPRRFDRRRATRGGSWREGCIRS